MYYRKLSNIALLLWAGAAFPAERPVTWRDMIGDWQFIITSSAARPLDVMPVDHGMCYVHIKATTANAECYRHNDIPVYYTNGRLAGGVVSPSRFDIGFDGPPETFYRLSFSGYVSRDRSTAMGFGISGLLAGPVMLVRMR